MSSKSAVVFGAGKIARGFIGHILNLSGFSITFVDVSPELVALVNERKQYTVHILGAPEKDTVVTNVSALVSGDPAITSAVAQADVVFVSVGGANLGHVAAPLAAALAERLTNRLGPLNVVVCENWRAAGETLKAAVLENLPQELHERFATEVGIAESTIMRSAIAATPAQVAADPLAVQSQNFWLLPIDGDALVPGFPEIETVDPVHNFANALERKLYTYNTGNATISFLGWLRGHSYLSEAANDPVIEEIAKGTYEEMGRAMVAKFGFDPEDQRQYAERSLVKFQDPEIVDPLTRQINDPLRKLGRHDRLVGAALVALEHGVRPDSVAIGIAAGLRHRNPNDPSAVKLAELIEQFGEGDALAQVAGIEKDHELIALVLSKLPEVDAITTGTAAP
ncbi:MAG: hypothetical protein JWP85_558 [Rhodoglobus sp.]|nr:hypothetical protein [Rhodoglobus sp.]